jgi:hypothetical protein
LEVFEKGLKSKVYRRRLGPRLAFSKGDMKAWNWIFALILSAPGFSAWGDGIVRESHPGYLDSVSEERYQQIEEMVLIPRPDTNEVNLREVIFNDKLSEEFQSRYEDTFGRTEAERNISGPINRFEELDYGRGRTASVQEDYENRQHFAEYMMRRLVEQHVDDYFKSNPAVRPIYELKEKVSKLNVEVKKGYKVRLNYSFSGNYMDVKVENPYDIDTRLRMQMGDGFGPGGMSEAILSTGYRFRNSVKVASYFYSERGKVSLVTSRPLTPGVGISLTGTSNYKYSANTEEGENLILLGLSWSQ